MSTTTDVIIVGAGIVGAACARALAREGFQVVVIDRQPIGSGATAASMGHVVVMDDTEAELALSQYSQRLWEKLYPSLPADCEVDHCGTLWIAGDDEEMAEVERKHRLYGERGIESEILNGETITQAEPNLRKGLAGGLRVPGDSVIYPPCAARRLLEEAQLRGAKTQVGRGVTAIENGSVTLEDGSTIQAHAVVNATGSWAPSLTPNLPVRPRKGHLIITDRYPGFARHQMIELGYVKSAHSQQKSAVAFVLQPRFTGQMLIGSSRELDKDDREIDPNVVRRILQRAIGFAPGLASMSAIRTWTGLRAATPDSLPIIGPHPEIPQLYLATGHEGHGITTALGTAEILVSHLTRSPAPIPTDPYLPDRFVQVDHHV